MSRMGLLVFHRVSSFTEKGAEVLRTELPPSGASMVAPLAQGPVGQPLGSPSSQCALTARELGRTRPGRAEAEKLGAEALNPRVR